jgi:hypothetical protein
MEQEKRQTEQTARQQHEQPHQRERVNHDNFQNASSALASVAETHVRPAAQPTHSHQPSVLPVNRSIITTLRLPQNTISPGEEQRASVAAHQSTVMPPKFDESVARVTHTVFVPVGDADAPLTARKM